MPSSDGQGQVMTLDEDEVYYLLQVLDATVNCMTMDVDHDVLILTMQEQALELLGGVAGDVRAARHALTAVGGRRATSRAGRSTTAACTTLTRPRAAVRWKIQSTGVNVARQLASARNRALTTWTQTQGDDPSGWLLPHPSALLWIPQAASAACLLCWWLDDRCDNVDVAAASARRHAAEHPTHSRPARARAGAARVPRRTGSWAVGRPAVDQFRQPTGSVRNAGSGAESGQL